MAVTVKTLPDPMPTEFPCPCDGRLVVFYATHDGHARGGGPSSQWHAETDAESTLIEMEIAVLRALGAWRRSVKCKANCNKIVATDPTAEHRTFSDPEEGRPHGGVRDIIAWHAITVVKATATISCFRSRS